jgi:hypothetical protein
MVSKCWRVMAISGLAGMLLWGCGGDDDDADDTSQTVAPATTSPGATTATSGDTGEQGDAVEVTVTDDAIEGLPTEIPSGVVAVTYTNNAAGASDLSFIRVAEDLTEEEFRTIFAAVVAEEGSPIPEDLQAVSGLSEIPPGGSTSQSVELEPGRHFVVAEPTADEEEEGGEGADTTAATEAPTTGAASEGGTAAAFVISEITVTEEASGADLPETDGTITALDYSFDVDVQPGETFTFINEGPDQIHHAVLIGFGTAEVATVEENLLAFFESEEDAPPPPGINPEEVSFEVGGSGVFTPTLSGTFDATIEAGNTYAAVCFIQDRAGGPPHIFGQGMFEVFRVE